MFCKKGEVTANFNSIKAAIEMRKMDQILEDFYKELLPSIEKTMKALNEGDTKQKPEFTSQPLTEINSIYDIYTLPSYQSLRDHCKEKNIFIGVQYDDNYKYVVHVDISAEYKGRIIQALTRWSSRPRSNDCYPD